jgi:hypothetical protein
MAALVGGAGGGGVDITPLCKAGIPCAGLRVSKGAREDKTDYYYYYHQYAPRALYLNACPYACMCACPVSPALCMHACLLSTNAERCSTNADTITHLRQDEVAKCTARYDVTPVLPQPPVCRVR